MMTSVSGERGVGKTAYLAEKVYEKHLQGCFIITNFTHVYSNIDASGLPPEKFIELLMELGEFKQAGYEMVDLFPTFTTTSVFVAFDEAHLYLGSDMWKRYSTDERFQKFIAFLAQARKLDVEIWHAEQDPSKIDKNMRRYTDEYIRLRAVFPWFKRIFVKHPTRPAMQAQLRLRFPLLWEELHHLEADNPTFNYKTVNTPDGGAELSKSSTLVSRKLRKTGWLKPFTYKLYDSYQPLALGRFDDMQQEHFPLLKNFAFIPSTMSPEHFPTFKKWLKMKLNDSVIPPRIRLSEGLFSLPVLDEDSYNRNVIKQSEEFLTDMACLTRLKGRLSLGQPKAAEEVNS